MTKHNDCIHDDPRIIELVNILDQYDIFEMNRFLHENPMNLNIHLSTKDTLLMYAMDKDEDAAMALIKAGADVNFKNQINTDFPLMKAASTDSASLGVFMITHGAKLALTNKKGRTALDVSSSNSVFRRSVNYLSVSDMPMIMIRDACYQQSVGLLDAAIDLNPNFEMFKHNGKNIVAFALEQNVPSSMMIRILEQNIMSRLNEKQIEQIIKCLRQGYGAVSSRQLFRYGVFAKMLRRR